MPELSSKIRNILSKHKYLKLLDNGKICCELSGHELPCREEILQEYIKGRKYKRLVQNKCQHLDQYKQFLELKQHAKSVKVHCILTHRLLNNEAAQVEKHVAGRRFQRELKRWNECKEQGVEYKSLCKKSLGKQVAEESSEEEADDLSDLHPSESCEALMGVKEEEKEDAEEEEEDEMPLKNNQHTPRDDVPTKPKLKRKNDRNYLKVKRLKKD